MAGELRRLVRRVTRALGIQLEPRPVRMARRREYAGYQIGEWTYGRPKVYDWKEGSTLRIGNFTSMAEGVVIFLGGEHRTDWVTTYPFSAIFPAAEHHTGHPRSRGDVQIGSDVWIGYGALILSGVTIGDGAVIAARSVVARSVEPYAIVSGNPARVLRYRFSREHIAALLQIGWWDWPLEKIKANWDLLLSPDIGPFVERHRPA